MYSLEIFWNDLTDHLPNFCLITSKDTKQQNEDRPFIRIYSASNIPKFQEKIKNTEVFHCTNAIIEISRYTGQYRLHNSIPILRHYLAQRQTRASI